LPATFNARAESVADKPMFRDAFKRHRCIIPASGYYEWIKRPDGNQPYYISGADGGVLSFAGLWDRWKNPDTSETTMSCTIIVTGCQHAHPSYSRPHAGAARQSGYRILAERHRRDRTASTGY
jgi:putative SOS response-associated peptidase YedK